MPGYGNYSLQVFNAQQSTIAAQRSVSYNAMSMCTARREDLKPASASFLPRAAGGAALSTLLSGCNSDVLTAGANNASTFLQHVFSDSAYTLDAIYGTGQRVWGTFTQHPVAFIAGFTVLASLIVYTEKKREAYIEAAPDEASRKRREWIPDLGPAIMTGAALMNAVEIARHMDDPLSPACQHAWGDFTVAVFFITVNKVLSHLVEKAEQDKKEGRETVSPDALRNLRRAARITCLLDDVAFPFLLGVRHTL